MTGVLVVDKPAKMTSHDVVAHVRRFFRTRRVGHAGTLDPMATGVLVLLLGEATKLSNVLTSQHKTYVTTVVLGTTTDSLDADGQVVGAKSVPEGWQTGEALSRALVTERERTLQIPPAISAIKVEGRRSYQLARRGQPVEHEPRPVAVHRLEVQSMGPKTLDLELDVSKGYYVRALARDLSSALGTVGHLSALRRVRSGAFGLDRAVPLPLTQRPPLASLTQAVRLALPCLSVTDQGALLLGQGRPIGRAELHAPPPSQTDTLAALHGERVIALVEAVGEESYVVKRGINDPGPSHEPAP